jgi:hypothetical protein
MAQLESVDGVKSLWQQRSRLTVNPQARTPTNCFHSSFDVRFANLLK